MPEITSDELWNRYCPEAEPEGIVELGEEAITQQLIELRYDAHQAKGEGDAVAMTCAEIARTLICHAEAWVEGREVLSHAS